MSDPKRIDVKRCARCGADHEQLAFAPFGRPSEIGDVTLTHWAACPTTGDPILMAVTERA